MSRFDYNIGEYIIIYAYSLPTVTSHTGHLKVGKASIKLSDYARAEDTAKAIEEAARERIREQLSTADISYNLEFAELAIKNDGKSFMDHDVHGVLQRSGFSKVQHTEEKHNGEWFATSIETVENAFKAVQEGRRSLNPNEIIEESNKINFRKGSQTEAIKKTLAAIDKGKKHFLWDAKMRFGKTLTALEIARQKNYGKVLIITHRPEVNDDWFKDFNTLFAGTDYSFGSRSKGEDITTLRNRCIRKPDGTCVNPFIYFASVQYLRHQVKSPEKLAILREDWDMLIVDEADEGIKTTLADEVISQIKRDFTLMLSGTPFNLLEDYDDNEIFSWDYTAEQKLKAEWDTLYPDEPNPYYKLPRLSIYTYELDKYLATSEFGTLYDKAFNFKEFFRTDSDGNFVHEKYVYQFLDLITTPSDSNFPYSSVNYRNNLRHTLWIVPGVKEARALEKLLDRHTIFGMRDNAGKRFFNVANVAGDGNEEVVEKESRKLVKKAITDDPLSSYSITISCGKMTRGVSVPEWSAVFMLSNTSSASTYLQTIFRAQTPWEYEGRLKTECFVFDFAPDRTLNVIAETMKIKKKTPTKDEVKEATGKFLNFCPVISATDGQMKEFSTQRLLQAIKRVAIQKVTHNGFDDTRLYNLENLSHCSDEELADFAELNKIVGQSSGVKDENKIKMADNGFTEEEYEQAEQAEKKKREKRELTPEEQELLRRKREIAEQRKTRISILRGVSIRMPMLIYGCKVDQNGHEIRADEEISLEQFIENVDDESWAEFMPEGVTKEMLRTKFAKYYDDEVFIGAGIEIRLRALAADLLAPSERVVEIGEIFKTFKNPDKETVLTPWKVVNSHISSTLGGADFNHIIELDEDVDKKGEKLGLPNWEDKGEITKLWSNENARVLEINSKSGLYPLLCAYNFYSQALIETIRNGRESEEDVFRELWDKILARNIYVLTKSPMAKTITERTLAGYTGAKTNVVYIPELIEKLKNEDFNLNKELANEFGLEGAEMLKFDAVVGNPPYQEMNTKNKMSRSIYPDFVRAAKVVGNKVSLVMPARWMSGENGPYRETQGFINTMISDNHLSNFTLFPSSLDVFKGVDIKGGICYWLWDINYNDKLVDYSVIEDGIISSDKVPFQQFDNIIVRFPQLVSIINKVFKESVKDCSMKILVSSRNPFGFVSDLFVKNNEKVSRISEEPESDDDYLVHGLLKGKRVKRYIPNFELKKNIEGAKAWKVFLPRANGSGVFGEVFSTPMIGTPMIGTPMMICTDTFLQVGEFNNKAEAENLLKYVKTKFFRAMVGVKKTAVFNYKDCFEFVPLLDFESENGIDWSNSVAELDRQLYKKYQLSDDEISFIETKVKPME